MSSPSPALLSAYLLHLLVPLVFLVDSLRVVSAGSADTWEKGVVVICTVWVLAALGGLAISRNRRRFLQRVSRPLMALYILYLSVVLLELGVRFGIQRFNRAVLHYPPGTKIVVHNLPRWGLPGMAPTVTFSVNELGLRGPLPPKQGPIYRIITVGGSTTECLDLDDSQEWSHALMQMMNERQKKYFVWVGNAGAAALTTVDHLACLRRRPILSQADLLIFLVGVNDMQDALAYDGVPTQKELEYNAELFLEHAPRGVSREGGIFRRLWLFPLVRDALRNLISLRRSLQHLPEPDAVFNSRAARAQAPVVPLPDLRVNLQEYAQRIRSLEQECHTRRLRCIFMTQPSLWRADLSVADRGLLWWGWVGRGHVRGFLSVGDLARAMDAFNQTLLRVCQEDHVECYDLASHIPKDTSAFYDDCHFNIGGAQLVAQLLAKQIAASPPFGNTP